MLFLRFITRTGYSLLTRCTEKLNQKEKEKYAALWRRSPPNTTRLAPCIGTMHRHRASVPTPQPQITRERPRSTMNTQRQLIAQHAYHGVDITFRTTDMRRHRLHAKHMKRKSRETENAQVIKTLKH